MGYLEKMMTDDELKKSLIQPVDYANLMLGVTQ
jgi:hypothetical protein